MYEDYWKITLEYSDIHGLNFKQVLNLIILFIDEKKLDQIDYDSSYYQELQERINAVYNKNYASTRKSINQFIKLGFVKPKLQGYHPLTKKFLKATSDFDRQAIFSKVVYESADFGSSVTTESHKHEINYLLKTLTYSGPLTKDDIAALMTVNVEQSVYDFMTRDELEEQKRYLDKIGFVGRKYNQLAYLVNIIKQLSEVKFSNDTFYLADEFIESESEELKKRDPYLHRIYKSELKEESLRLYNNVQCFLEKLPYKGLVASHMKPFKVSNKLEEYDPNNGLLLSQNMDAYFDKFEISFNDDGTILISSSVHPKIKDKIKDFILDKELLTPERLTYLGYHRIEFLRRTTLVS